MTRISAAKPRELVSREYPWLEMSPCVLFATGHTGVPYNILATTRIYISHESLRPLATRLAQGFVGAAELTTPPAIVLMSGSSEQAGSGDVELRLEVPDTSGVVIPVHGEPEKYRIDVTAFIRVAASNLTAMARALTTLHKAVRISTELTRCIVIDAPAFAERSVMIDMGRRQFTPDWMICLIQEMAWNQLNTLHLHLTDNEGVRVIFPSYPDLSSSDSWSAADLKRVLDTAASYYVQVIPELDMPGHMDWILRNRPEFQLKLSNGTVVTKALDFSLAAARAFMKTLFSDLMNLFPDSRYIHLGADEYFLSPITPANTPQLAAYARAASGNPSATSEDAVRYFVNDVANLIKEKGKIARVWNDGAVQTVQHITLDKQVQIECWSIWGSVREHLNVKDLVDSGYSVINAHGDFYFIVNRSWDNLYHPLHSPRGIHDVWRPNRFMDEAGNNYTEIAVGHPAMVGGGIQLWIERPTFSSPEEMWTQLRPWLLPLGQRTWGSPHAVERLRNLPLLSRVMQTPPPVPWW
ncbi:family 20 glycosylhydrolase [Pseudomonas sp. Irchel s3a10]|uniref:family 20 glycosylhydrolase n=1 Tax=Pseudomonas sp. Irchel s3a10 TaxID=2009045 RepID=UPI000BA3458B|nr:family 20 glycosylhydrolase [Pseudomonas sp. Irchel s3a10]